MTTAQTPTSEPSIMTFTSDFAGGRGGSTKSKSCFVEPGSTEKPSVCIVYLPGGEPIAEGFTGVIDVKGGGSSDPLRTMRLDLWDKLPQPVQINAQVPPVQFGSKFWSFDMKPGANFNVDFDIWSKMVQSYSHLREGLDMGWLKVFTPNKTHKGSADCSIAFKTSEATIIVRNTFSQQILESWLQHETREGVKKAINSQLKKLRGEAIVA